MNMESLRHFASQILPNDPANILSGILIIVLLSMLLYLSWLAYLTPCFSADGTGNLSKVLKAGSALLTIPSLFGAAFHSPANIPVLAICLFVLAIAMAYMALPVGSKKLYFASLQDWKLRGDKLKPPKQYTEILRGRFAKHYRAYFLSLIAFDTSKHPQEELHDSLEDAATPKFPLCIRITGLLGQANLYALEEYPDDVKRLLNEAYTLARLALPFTRKHIIELVRKHIIDISLHMKKCEDIADEDRTFFRSQAMRQIRRALKSLDHQSSEYLVAANRDAMSNLEPRNLPETMKKLTILINTIEKLDSKSRTAILRHVKSADLYHNLACPQIGLRLYEDALATLDKSEQLSLTEAPRRERLIAIKRIACHMRLGNEEALRIAQYSQGIACTSADHVVIGWALSDTTAKLRCYAAALGRKSLREDRIDQETLSELAQVCNRQYGYLRITPAELTLAQPNTSSPIGVPRPDELRARTAREDKLLQTARAAQDAIYAGLAAYYEKNGGLYPSRLDDPNFLALLPNQVLPEIDLELYGHPRSCSVETFEFKMRETGVDVGSLKDTGNWLYDSTCGTVTIDCLHIPWHRF